MMMIFAAAILSAQTRVDNSRAMDSILVKDWVPDSSLVVPETNILKARFPAIDVHVHARGNLGDTRESLAAWVQIMDEAGVEKMIVLSEATGAEFDRLADLYQKNYPNRFQLWCGLDEQEFENPDYPERAAAELERCYRKGGRGVGELSDKGWGIMGGIVAVSGSPPVLPRERRMHLDDPRLDLFWKKCAQLKIPVSLHVADHPSAWRPPDNHQERTPRYQTYNQFGSDVPSYEELLARRDRLLARHTDTTFIAVHLSNQGNDLAALSKALDRFPNLYVDISARDYELGRQPRAAARLLEKYKDRVLYGSDSTPATSMYRGWWRLMESPDEYIPGPVWWRLYGLSLQDEVLDAIYRGNARRILNWN
jgi:predicted TIM-barrel fold metal-dependent hydrolase